MPSLFEGMPSRRTTRRSSSRPATRSLRGGPFCRKRSRCVIIMSAMGCSEVGARGPVNNAIRERHVGRAKSRVWWNLPRLDERPIYATARVLTVPHPSCIETHYFPPQVWDNLGKQGCLVINFGNLQTAHMPEGGHIIIMLCLET